MKKIISIIFVFFCSLSINAQWNGSFATNEYTDEKIPQVVYEFKYDKDKPFHDKDIFKFS